MDAELREDLREDDASEDMFAPGSDLASVSQEEQPSDLASVSQEEQPSGEQAWPSVKCCVFEHRVYMYTF